MRCLGLDDLSDGERNDDLRDQFGREPCRMLALSAPTEYDVSQNVLARREGHYGMPRNGLAALGRFSEPTLLILISLADGPKHGYAMVEDIHSLSGERLGPGTLYGAIARLERLGLIAPLPAQDRRRPYELTQAGSTVLRSELDSLARLSKAGLRRLAATA